MRQRSKRIVVAYVEVESPQARMIRHLIDGDGKAGDKPRSGDRYWCAADRPQTDDTFRVAPVYRTNAVAEDAECEHCGISIRELQAFMGEVRKS